MESLSEPALKTKPAAKAREGIINLGQCKAGGVLHV